MSRLLTLCNALKHEARFDWLTDSQQMAWRKIEREWQLPQRINLYGEVGVGKTFLGWALARRYEAEFHPAPHYFLESVATTTTNIIDNAPSETIQLRDLLGELQLRAADRVLLISRAPNYLGIPTLQLPLPTVRDRDVLYRNLSYLEHYAPSTGENRHFWQLLFSTL